MVSFRVAVAAALLQLASAVAARGHDEHGSKDMGDMKMDAEHHAAGGNEVDLYALPSYSGLSAHSSMMLAHIVLMILAWFFILPIGVMFSITRSRYALPVQFLFLALNSVGVICSTIYNVSTPDLYENNAHHKIGWIATWVMTVQVIMSLLFLYTGRPRNSQPETSERAAFLPVSTENMAGFTASPISPYHDYRWSGDNAHRTERSFSGTTQNSRDISPTDPNRLLKEEGMAEDDEDEEGLPMATSNPQRRSRFRIKAVDTFLSKRLPGIFSAKLLKMTEVIYEVVDRTILVLGFIALVSGGVTFTGIFRGNNIFSGLAHFVKGGVFVWYGLLTLGRWMGCFANWGWAWNIKPSRPEVGQWRSRIPSAEFTESFVIWLYGATNVWLEHLAAWGHEWSAQDLEHVSISIMFFGGGLCGMLVESQTVRSWLNTSVELMPTRTDLHPAGTQTLQRKPRNYNTSLNPIPGLIILLLGVMMSSHHQDSMVSTMVHKQWGTLLVGFSLARGVTYIIMYISPPSSIWPSRPPSELVAAFCLISGGIVFMASTRDIVHYMEEKNLMAMFIFTVTMGFTAFLMAYEIIVLSLKGWATRRENNLQGTKTI